MQGAGAANLPAQLKIDLEASTILFVDANVLSLEVLSSVFYGFGARERVKATSIEAATSSQGFWSTGGTEERPFTTRSIAPPARRKRCSSTTRC